MTLQEIVEFITTSKPDEKILITQKDLAYFAKSLSLFCYEDCKRMVTEELGKIFMEQNNDSKTAR